VVNVFGVRKDGNRRLSHSAIERSHSGTIHGGTTFYSYEAVGGTVTRDLFSGDDEGLMIDTALVRRLAIEKLEAKAAELRAQWAWTKAVLDPEYRFMGVFIGSTCPRQHGGLRR
jgi:ParB family chromosome partitioning protein